jgi:hypothetical protein
VILEGHALWLTLKLQVESVSEPRYHTLSGSQGTPVSQLRPELVLSEFGSSPWVADVEAFAFGF